MASIGSRGDKLDLTFRQGATFGPVPVRMVAPSGTPINLDGATVRAVMRKTYASPTPYAFVCQIVDAADGRFTFGMSDEATAAIACGASPSDPASLYVWDLEVAFADGSVMPVFYGSVKVAPEATK